MQMQLYCNVISVMDAKLFPHYKLGVFDRGIKGLIRSNGYESIKKVVSYDP